MRDIAVVIGSAALVALAGWLVGSLALRIAGVLVVLAGLFGAATGQPQGLLVATIGLLAWLVGHWLYGVRHHYFVSPLASRLFQQTPLRRVDPTQGWVASTVADEATTDGGYAAPPLNQDRASSARPAARGRPRATHRAGR